MSQYKIKKQGKHAGNKQSRRKGALKKRELSMSSSEPGWRTNLWHM
jgi:hypothetical protein